MRNKKPTFGINQIYHTAPEYIYTDNISMRSEVYSQHMHYISLSHYMAEKKRGLTITSFRIYTRLVQATKILHSIQL